MCSDFGIWFVCSNTCGRLWLNVLVKAHEGPAQAEENIVQGIGTSAQRDALVMPQVLNDPKIFPA